MICFKVYIACKRKSFSDCCEIFCVKDDWRSQICYRGGDTKEVLQGSHSMHDVEYYFVRNNKGTNNNERINFRSSSGTYLVYSWLYR